VLCLLFELEGYVVRWLPDGEAALRALAAGPPDVIVSDIHMPRLDGLELWRSMRKQGFGVPLLLMSAGILSPGADVPFIRKPFDSDDLLAAVARLLPAAAS